MRFVAFATLGLTISVSAFAQETAPPPPAVTSLGQPPIDYLKEPPDNNARERGKGAMLLTVGSILLPLGIGMLGASAPIWDGYSSSCNYSCDKYVPYLAGGLTLDILGTLVFAGGATLLAVGAQKYVEHKKPMRYALNGFHF